MNIAHNANLWTGFPPQADADIDSLADRLFSRMYERDVIFVCPACDAANAITNAVCCRCGQPLGNAPTRTLREARPMRYPDPKYAAAASAMFYHAGYWQDYTND